VKEAGDLLRGLARDGKAKPEARQAAIDGLAILADAESGKVLRELSVAPNPAAIRFRAASALAQLDLNEGANAAARALSEATDNDDPAPLIESFLLRKNGSDQLAAALEKQKISQDAAKRMLRAMYLAGRNDPALGKTIGRLAGVEEAPKPPTVEEMKVLIQEVQAKGDAARGERVFHRADLGCLTCHAIHNAGGNVGPDLGPIGGSSPVDYVITSILDPNQAIKEEYLTRTIITTKGQIVTGIVVERNKNQLTLKDATGKLMRIPAAEVEEETQGKSLMPEGVTRILTRGELIDLARFVSELGKPGSAFATPNTSAVQRWRKLREVPATLLDGVPNRDVLRDTVLRHAPEAWDTTYARFNGVLQLDELRKPGVIYLQGEVNAVQPGPVEIVVDTKTPYTLWLDEEEIAPSSKGRLVLNAGRHRVTLRLTLPAEAKADGLKVEVRKPNGSRGQIELVNSGD
jgi:putative heme-binding domain-containing protein